MRAVSEAEVTEKKHATDEQQAPRRERSRRRNDDKRQAQTRAKALNVEEQSVQENRTGRTWYVRFQPRRKQRPAQSEVRYEQSVAEEAVVAPVVEETVAAEPIVQEAPAPRTELVKVPLPVVAQTAPEQQRREQC